MPAMTMIEAIRSAMDVMMERDDNVVVFGEDVGYFGGVFRCTEGLQAKYGSDARLRHADHRRRHHRRRGRHGRLRAATRGRDPVRRLRLSRARPADLGGRAAALPFGGRVHRADDRAHAVRRRHLRRPDAQPEPGGLFTHVVRAEDGGAVESVRREGAADRRDRGRRPGDLPRAEAALQRTVRRPSRPADRAVVEHPLGEVPDGYYRVDSARAAIRRPGDDLTVLAYGTMVHVAEAAAAETGIDAEIIDLRTLLPLDIDTIDASVEKTGRCVIVHEATRTSGFGAELSAHRAGACFYHLEAPIERVTGWDTPYPHAQEWAYFPGPARVGAAMRE